MARRQLTTDDEVLRGTSKKDTFNARLASSSDLGIPLNTLNGGDRLDGLQGRDKLVVEASTTFLSDYYVRPALRSIEQITIRSTGDDGDDFVLDLGGSKGTRLVESIGSGTNVEIRNAGATNTFVLREYQGEPAGGSFGFAGGLEARGITKSTVTATIVESDATVRLDKKGALDFNTANLTLVDSNISLDVGTSQLQLTSTGTGEENSVSVSDEFDRVTVSGDVLLEFEGEDGQELEINQSFSAAGSSAGVDVEAAIFGETLALVEGSGVDDSFRSIFSEAALTVSLGAGDDELGEEDSDGVSALGGVTLTAGAGADFVRFDGALGVGANDSIDMGDDDDILEADNLDLDATGTVDKVAGGAGTDTLAGDFSGFTAAEGSNITGFEELILQGSSSGDYDLSGVPGISTITVRSFLDVSFSNVANATNFAIEESFTIVDIEGAGATDLANVNIAVGANVDLPNEDLGTNVDTTLDVEGFNTVTLESRGPGASGENAVFLDAIDSESLVIRGSEDIALASFNNSFTTINAAAASGDVDLTDVELGTGPTTITDGSGNDILRGSEDADIFNLTTGGLDNVLFRSLFESDGANPDTLNGFDAAGNDTLQFEILGVVDGLRQGTPNVADGNNLLELVFLGNTGTSPDAAAALAASDVANPEDIGMVFDQATNSLLIDVDQSGTFVAGGLDVRIVINDVNDALTLQDFELV